MYAPGRFFMTKTKSLLQTLALIALSASLLCVISPFAIPLPYIPITLATFAIYVCSSVLGAAKGTISVLLYLAIGIVGVPVFSGFQGGVQKLFGPTGGFLIGFLLMAFVTGFVADRFENKKYMYAVGMVLGTILCYILGTVWLMQYAKISLVAALPLAVFPFLAGDAIKIIAATQIAPVVRKAISKI